MTASQTLPSPSDRSSPRIFRDHSSSRERTPRPSCAPDHQSELRSRRSKQQALEVHDNLHILPSDLRRGPIHVALHRSGRPCRHRARSGRSVTVSHAPLRPHRDAPVRRKINQSEFAPRCADPRCRISDDELRADTTAGNVAQTTAMNKRYGSVVDIRASAWLSRTRGLSIMMFISRGRCGERVQRSDTHAR